MISPRQQSERRQLLIFGLICIAMLIVGFAWAIFGDAADVTPVATATATVMQATPTT
jgi:hypothetical protein